jgi:hypothetical protein
MEVRAADRGRGDPYDGVGGLLDARVRNLGDLDVLDALPGECAHVTVSFDASVVLWDLPLGEVSEPTTRAGRQGDATAEGEAMTDEATQPAGGEEPPPRVHPQDPAEGADPDDDQGTDQPRVRPQDPAEGGDDGSATS